MKKHGEFTFSWDKDIFMIDVKGPLNEEAQEDANNAMKSAILQQGLKRWRRLETLNEDTMGSPAVMALVTDLFAWYDNNGCYAAAIVVKNSLQVYAINEIFKSSTVCLFDNLAEAKTWLDEQYELNQ